MPVPFDTDALLGAEAADLPDGEPGNVPTFRELLALRTFLRSAAKGLLTWGGRLRVDPGGAASGDTGVVVGAVAAASVHAGATSVQRSGTLNETLVNTVSHVGADLAASTWYYAYLGVDAGAIVLRVDVTGPADGMVWKTGTSLYRYLGCFRTDTSGVPLPLRAHRGRYLYRASAIAGGAGGAGGILRALDGGADASWTDVILRPSGTTAAALIPPHARVARLRVSAWGGASGGSVQLRTNGDTTAYVSVPVTAGADAVAFLEVETDEGQTLEYQVTGTAQAVVIEVLGWEE